MGAMKNQLMEGIDKKKSRGSVDNTSRLEAFAKGGGKGSADWGGCDPAWLQAVLIGITSIGGAATFGLSRDQGAHSLTLLLDDTKKTLWFNGDADLNEELAKVVATLESMT